MNQMMSAELLAALAFFRAIFHIFPIASPLLAPFKGQIASLTNLGFETVFGFSFHNYFFFAR
ncbi:MAG: hypothetical protein RI899_652 [Actinomycetota bacterium]|jgi:hypothetical protein